MYYLCKGKELVSMCADKGTLETLCINNNMTVIEDSRLLDISTCEVKSGVIVNKSIVYTPPIEIEEQPKVDTKALLKSMLDLTDAVLVMQGQIEELGGTNDGEEVE